MQNRLIETLKNLNRSKNRLKMKSKFNVSWLKYKATFKVKIRIPKSTYSQVIS